MSTIQLVGAAVFVLAGIAFLAQGARTDVLRAAGASAVAGAVGSDLATVAAAAVLLLVPLAVLFSRVSSAAGTLSYDVAAHFSVLRNVAVLVFVGYAVAWLLGALVLGGTVLALVYLVIDLLAGVGFGLLLVRDPSLLRG